MRNATWTIPALSVLIILAAASGRAQVATPSSSQTGPQTSSQSGNPVSGQPGARVSGQEGVPVGALTGTQVSGQAGTPVGPQTGTGAPPQAGVPFGNQGATHSGLQSSGQTNASTSSQFRECAQRDVSLDGMNRCAVNEVAQAESDLDETYKTLRSKAGQVPGALEKAEELQKVWTQYRDAYIAAMFPATDKQAAYGSVYGMNVDLLRAALTRNQIARLRELATRYSEGGK